MAQYHHAKNIKKCKELSQQRIQKSALMNIRNDEFGCNKRNMLDYNKENKNTSHKIAGKKYCRPSIKIDDKDVVDPELTNPFLRPPLQLAYNHKPIKRPLRKIPFISHDPHTITDIYSSFYKEIEGRPLRQFIDLKDYMRNIRYVTLTRSTIAFLRDQMAQTDMLYKYELGEYHKIVRMLTSTEQNFIKFANAGYRLAKELQELAEKRAAELRAVNIELNAYSFEFVRLRNEISHIGNIFETLNSYRRFLFKVAPLSWQKTHNEEFRGLRFYFEKLDAQPMIRSELSLEFEMHKQDMMKARTAQLYFKKPEDMYDLFECISGQCLNYMHIATFRNTIIAKVLKNRDYLRHLAQEHIKELQELVEYFKKDLKRLQEEEFLYKNLFEVLLTTNFYKLYAKYDVSKLFTCVQYVFTRVLGGVEDPKNNIADMMCHLEWYYIKLNKAMDNMDQKIIEKVTKQAFSEDLIALRNAQKAQRQLRECEILGKALFTSFEPPRLRLQK